MAEQQRRPRGEPEGGGGYLHRADLDFIGESLKTITQAFEVRVHTVNGALVKVETELEAIDKLLRGDGVEGLVPKLALLGERQNTMQKQLDKNQATLNKILAVAIGLLVSVIGTLVAVLAKN